jgi:hypothetical protein
MVAAFYLVSGTNNKIFLREPSGKEVVKNPLDVMDA